MRIVPALDERPAVVAFAQTPAGKAALVTAFVALLALRRHPGLAELWCVLLAIALKPAWRGGLMFGGTVYWWFVYGGPGMASPIEILDKVGVRVMPLDWPEWLEGQPVVLALTLAFMGGYWLCVRAAGGRGPFRRPVATFLCAYVALIHVACYAPIDAPTRTVLRAVIVAQSALFWYFAYALAERGVRELPDAGVRLSAFAPFWGSTATPIPRGPATLGRTLAKTDEELAVTRLKGLKLLIWCTLLAALVPALGQAGLARVPGLRGSLERYAAGAPDPRGTGWLTLVVHMVGKVLAMAIYGHTVVAILRMCGFRARRNTYRPFEATTILEFYNRYYYYFKELLVDFFFFPTYARWFTKSPRLRVLFAMFVALGFGNFLYHYLDHPEYAMAFGFWGGIAAFHSYLVYAAILSIALGLSQLYGNKTPAHPWLARLWVFFFFTVISAFDVVSPKYGARVYLGYVAYLFGF